MSSKENNIKEKIKEFTELNLKRNRLNREIKQHYEPLIMQASIDKDHKRVGELLAQLPDCPFLMTAYRIVGMYAVEQDEVNEENSNKNKKD